MPKPRAIDASLLTYCEALEPDACTDDTCAASHALAADGINRDLYIACQRLQRGLVDYVLELIERGWVASADESR